MRNTKQFTVALTFEVTGMPEAYVELVMAKNMADAITSAKMNLIYRRKHDGAVQILDWEAIEIEHGGAEDLVLHGGDGWKGKAKKIGSGSPLVCVSSVNGEGGCSCSDCHEFRTGSGYHEYFGPVSERMPCPTCGGPTRHVGEPCGFGECSTEETSDLCEAQ